ncbi:MAG: hypothetical protein WD029_03525 [Microthrixaceae bacterium]
MVAEVQRQIRKKFGLIIADCVDDGGGGFSTAFRYNAVDSGSISAAKVRHKKMWSH